METNEKKLTLKGILLFFSITLTIYVLVITGSYYIKKYSDQEEQRKASEVARDKIVAEAKATISYQIACLEAGMELDITAPEVERLALTIFHASKFFNTSEEKLARLAYHHSEEIKKHGVNMNVKTLLEAAMDTLKTPNSPLGKPTIETLNLYGSMVQRLSRSKKF